MLIFIYLIFLWCKLIFINSQISDHYNYCLLLSGFNFNYVNPAVDIINCEGNYPVNNICNNNRNIKCDNNSNIISLSLSNYFMSGIFILLIIFINK